MKTQRPSQPPDLHEQLGEVGFLGEEFGELVDDDEQTGQGWQIGAPLAGPLVVPYGDQVPRVTQHLLTAVHLARHDLLHPVDEGEVVLQVGDDSGHVRQLGHPGEGRAALEVDQDEVELVGRVGRGHGQHEGAQQFGLARTGGADQEAVRPHAVLRGLLDVQVEDASVGGQSDGDPQPVPQRARAPQLVQVEPARVPYPDEAGQRGVGVVQVLGRHRPGVQPEPGELLGQRLRLGDGERVRRAEVVVRLTAAHP
ncbi:hypothetical protein GA0115255_111291, partial [Streptomyces sp. Ncost-T6T-2b]